MMSAIQLAGIAAVAAGIMSLSACTTDDYAGTSKPAEGTHVTLKSAHLESGELGEIARVHTFGDIFLASQPSPADFELAKTKGIKTVINQRNAAELGDFDERAFVTALGMTYENPSFGSLDQLTDAKIDDTLQLLRTAQRPLLMHCGSANRVGALWFAYRAIEDGLSIDEALAEAKTVGLRSPGLEQVVRDYIARHK